MSAALVSVIVPALDEAVGIVQCLASAAPLRARGHEVIVVDGGSEDGTREAAAPLCDRVLDAPRGRARQMNAGARAARGEALLFLHADTRLPAEADAQVLDALRDRLWGRFDVEIDAPHPLLRLVERGMNLRSRLTGIATGDQAIFVRRSAFGGFPDIPLMEDVAFSAAMRKAGRPACLRTPVVTSGRRWLARGPLRTVVLMWRLRLEFALGVDPIRLAGRYR